MDVLKPGTLQFLNRPSKMGMKSISKMGRAPSSMKPEERGGASRAGGGSRENSVSSFGRGFAGSSLGEAALDELYANDAVRWALRK